MRTPSGLPGGVHRFGRGMVPWPVVFEARNDRTQIDRPAAGVFPPMALSATPYRVRIALTDTDRGVYGDHTFTIARHPSETGLRMTARLLAWGLWWHERLAFGRGLSDVDEPALWLHALDGQVEHWIDVGRPDADRMIRSARHQPRASVLAYGSTETWLETVLPKVRMLPSLEIAVLPPETEALADDLPRAIDWSLMIADDVLLVSDGDGQHELPLVWAKRRET